MSAVSDPEKGLDAGEKIVIVDELTNTIVGAARRADMVSLGDLNLGSQAAHRLYWLVHSSLKCEETAPGRTLFLSNSRDIKPAGKGFKHCLNTKSEG